MKTPLVLGKKEVKHILAMAPRTTDPVLLSLAYGCGMPAGEDVRLKVGDIDSAQKIIPIVQPERRKKRNVMLPSEILRLLREWPHRSGQGCVRARARAFRPGRFGGYSKRQRGKLGSQNQSRCTRCGIVLAHTFWSGAWISASVRRLLAMPNGRPQRAVRARQSHTETAPKDQTVHTRRATVASPATRCMINQTRSAKLSLGLSRHCCKKPDGGHSVIANYPDCHVLASELVGNDNI